MSLALHVFAIEIKKAVSYRVAFWVNFLLGTTTDLLIAYFLWGAIFAASGSQTMQGFSFHGMVFYYLFAKMIGGRRILSSEVLEPLSEEYVRHESDISTLRNTIQNLKDSIFKIQNNDNKNKNKDGNE